MRDGLGARIVPRTGTHQFVVHVHAFHLNHGQRFTIRAQSVVLQHFRARYNDRANLPPRTIRYLEQIGMERVVGVV